MKFRIMTIILVLVLVSSVIIRVSYKQPEIDISESNLTSTDVPVIEHEETLIIDKEEPISIDLGFYSQEPVEEHIYFLSEDYSYIESTVLPSEYNYSLNIDGIDYFFTEDQWYDIDQIARVVFAESGNQTYECRLATAVTIMNRVTCTDYDFATGTYNDSRVVKVLSAPNQFHAWLNSYYYNDPTDENIVISAKAYLGLHDIPSNVLFFCLGYFPDGWGTYPYYDTFDEVSFYTYG